MKKMFKEPFTYKNIACPFQCFQIQIKEINYTGNYLHLAFDVFHAMLRWPVGPFNLSIILFLFAHGSNYRG